MTAPADKKLIAIKRPKTYEFARLVSYDLMHRDLKSSPQPGPNLTLRYAGYCLALADAGLNLTGRLQHFPNFFDLPRRPIDVVTMPEDFQASKDKLGNDTFAGGRAACDGSTR